MYNIHSWNSVDERTHARTLSALLFNDNTLYEWQLKQYKNRNRPPAVPFAQFSFVFAVIFIKGPKYQMANAHTHTESVQSQLNVTCEMHHIKMKCSGGSYSCVKRVSLCVFVEKWAKHTLIFATIQISTYVFRSRCLFHHFNEQRFWMIGKTA